MGELAGMDRYYLIKPYQEIVAIETDLAKTPAYFRLSQIIKLLRTSIAICRTVSP
jgi:hypothetical protein